MAYRFSAQPLPNKFQIPYLLCILTSELVSFACQIKRWKYANYFFAEFVQNALSPTCVLSLNVAFGCQPAFKSSTYTLVDPLFCVCFSLFFALFLYFFSLIQEKTKTDKLFWPANSMQNTHAGQNTQHTLSFRYFLQSSIIFYYLTGGQR